MEPIDNDMDDLFQKAGELYPLKISESDWDGVAGKLRDENSEDLNALSGLNTREIRNKHRWRLLLLLIPLGLAGLVYISKLVKQQHASPVPITVKNNSIPETKETKTIPSALVKQISRSNNDKTAAINPGIQNEPFSKNTQVQSNSTVSGYSQFKNGMHSTNGPTKNYSAGKGGQSKNELYPKYGNIPAGADKISKANNPPADASAFNPESFHEPVAKPISLSVYGPNEIVSIYGMPFSLGSSRGVSLKSPLSETASKQTSNKTQSFKGIYAGFLFGPDMSTVDFQSIKQPGFSLGVLAGYRFNKRLAIETGFMWDKKYYYSDGDHFNKSQANIPPNIYIQDLNGNCNMFEIPIALRYDFAFSKNHVFFAKAGLSSYLMKKENYSYNAVSNGVQYPAYNLSYNTSTDYIFSIVQFSAGYEIAISRKTEIRIEPYFKIPLQGIGIGSMPISSAGFYLGISHSFR